MLRSQRYSPQSVLCILTGLLGIFVGCLGSDDAPRSGLPDESETAPCETGSACQTNPTLSLLNLGDTGQSDSDQVTSRTNLILTGEASPGVELEVLDLEQGGRPKARLTVPENGIWYLAVEFPVASGSESVFRLVAEAKWASGGEARSEVLLLTIDRRPPDAPQNATPAVVETSFPTFSWAAVEDAVVYQATPRWNPGAAVETSGLMFTTSLDSRVATVDVRSVDLAGNVSAATQMTVTVVGAGESEEAWSLALIARDDTGLSDHDGMTNLSVLSFESRSEPFAPIELVLVDGNEPLGMATADADGRWRLEAVDFEVTEGTQSTFRLVAQSASIPRLLGRSTILDVTIDRIAPSKPANDGTLEVSDHPRPTFSWTPVSDAVLFLVLLPEEEVLIDETRYQPSVDLSPGTNTARIVSIDAAGNFSMPLEITVEVQIAP